MHFIREPEENKRFRSDKSGQERDGVAHAFDDRSMLHEADARQRSSGEETLMSHTPEVAKFAVDEPDVARALNSFLLGHIIDGEEGPTDAKYYVDSRALLKNMLICGSLGTGKTTACIQMLSTLWRKHKIPFLIFESHTTRCRMPVLLAEPFLATTRLFTLGNKSVSPLQINAFEVPAGADSQSHIDGLMLLFQTSFKMSLSESDFLRQALILMYQQGRRPTIEDLERCTTNQSFGFAGKKLERLRQKIASILIQLRRGAKSDLFAGKSSSSHKNLFSQPAVIELREATSDAEKNFCLNVLLFLLYQNRRSDTAHESLRHLLVLDDAERMINTGAPYLNVNEKSDALSAAALASNLIAQLRFYGHGLVTTTSNPGAIPDTIVNNSNVRVILRLLGDADYKTVCGGTFLNDYHRRVIASQGKGCAVVYKDGDIFPYHVSIPFEPALQIRSPETAAESDDVVREVMSALTAKR